MMPGPSWSTRAFVACWALALAACSTCAGAPASPSLPPLPPPPPGLRVAVGEGFACAIGPRGQLACWGPDPGTTITTMQSGDGIPDRPRPTRSAPRVVLERATEVLAGSDRWCARTEDARVLCASGGGLEGTDPHEIPALHGRATGAPAAGVSRLALDPLGRVCALDAEGALLCAGPTSTEAEVVASGIVEVMSSALPGVLLVRTTEGRLRAFRPGDDGTTEPEVRGIDGAVADLVEEAPCVRLAAGGLACFDWGARDEGGVRFSPVIPGDRFGMASPVCTLLDGDLACPITRGARDLGTQDPQDILLGDAPIVRGVSSYAIGPESGCALTREHRVLCWGRNDVGQAGPLAADPTSRTRVEGLPRVTALVPHDEAACALDEDGGLWCWGTVLTGLAHNGSPRGVGLLALRPVRLEPVPPLASIDPALHAITRDGRAITLRPSGTGPEHETFSSNDAFHVPTPASPGPTRFETRVAACEIEDGAVFCTGRARYGLRGDGTSEVSVVPTEIDMPAGWR